MKKRTSEILAAAAATVLVGAWALPALATTYTWTGANEVTDTNWDDAANYSANSGFPVSGDTVIFQTTGAYSASDVYAIINTELGSTVVGSMVTVDGTQAVNTIQFNANTTAYVIGSAVNAGTIDLDAGGKITTAVTSTGSPKASVINAALVLEGNATFSSLASTGASANLNQAPLQIDGSISNAPSTTGNISITGASGNGVVLDGNNSGFTGTVTLTNGTLGLGGSATVLGASNTLYLNSASTIFWNVSVTNTNYVVGSNMTGTFGGNQSEGGTLTINSGDTLTVGTGGGNAPGFSALVEGQGNLTINQGTFTLSGTAGNTLSGTTTFSVTNGNGQSTLNLSKSGTGVNAIAVDGAFKVTAGSHAGIVVWNGNGEVNSATTPSFSQSATITNTIELNGFTQTFAGMTDTGIGATVENNSATLASTLNLATSGSNTFDGVLANGAAAVLNLGVSGSGSQSLTAANTYTGTTSITGGALALTGTGSLGNTAISITAGSFAPRAGTFAGSGSASLSLSGTGTFDMTGDNGNTLGTFTLNGSGTALTLTGGGTMLFDLGSTLGSNDSLSVGSAGTASTSGTTDITIDTTGDASLALGNYTLITAASGLGSGFALSSSGVTIGANSYAFSLSNSNSGAEILTVSNAVVPEPASLSLLGIGAAGLLARRRRRA